MHPAAALFLAPAMSLAAQTAPAEAPQTQSFTTAQTFTLAQRAEAAGRLRDAETIYRALMNDPDPEMRIEARFRLGMMFARAKRYSDAAQQFRAILDERPDAQRVRIELAQMLAALGDTGAARRELRQAQAGGLPPEVAQLVNQFANVLRSRKPWGASLSLALVPDSNINRATDAKTLDTIIAPLDLSRDARSQSGLGAQIGGQAYFRVPIGARVALVPRVSGEGVFYRKSQFDDVSGSAQLGIEWSPGRERLQLSGGATMRWYGGDPYARTATATLDWQHPLGKRAQLSASGTVAQTDYRLNDLQDGMLYAASLGVERAFGARSGGGLTFSGIRLTARDPGYASVSGGAQLLLWRELGRTTFYASLSARRLEADARLFLYPRRRSDTQFGATAGATLRTFSFKGFAPIVRVSWERNASTVGIYDYRRIATTIGLTRAF